MHNAFFIGDTHFGHSNILKFTRDDGSPLRPFATIEEHDEAIVENWNKVVRPQDKVYHLGDCVINRRCLPILARLNGHKRLVRGNHDIFTTKDFMQYFEEIYGVRVLPKLGIILSHIPIHPESLSRWKANIHGHLHHHKVKQTVSKGLTHLEIDDPRYINVSCEQINYTPIAFDQIFDR